MRREDLMKPDILSNVLVLGSGVIMLAALLLVMVLAVTHPGTSVLPTISQPHNYSSLPMWA